MLWARGSGHDRYLSVAVCLSVERGRPGSGFHPRACSAAHVARIDPRPAIVAALLAYTFFFFIYTVRHSIECLQLQRRRPCAVGLVPETTSIVSHFTQGVIPTTVPQHTPVNSTRPGLELLPTTEADSPIAGWLLLPTADHLWTCDVSF